ncbi:MAG: hypothetical protein C0617_11125 [Desulfuromonas sp.]|uniref:hypothetical protein n=1 Tax=Desulfuromonas sp. TaxID=892 RepID=UPI000CB7175E|nr:hypothetical protein [Desulfuromonas sp.]PLX83678.1 MAG: hypothetical protein C0617_11125 [Desulfuromonas sp.]
MFFLVRTVSNLLLSAVVLLFVISSAFYMLLNYKYYYISNGWNVQNNAKVILRSIDCIIEALSYGNIEVEFEKDLLESFIEKEEPRITVEKYLNGFLVYTVKKEKELREERTIVHVPPAEISDGSAKYVVSISDENKPPWYLHLSRAWTFSNGKGFQRLEDGSRHPYWYRSEPLIYSFVITLFFLILFYYGLLSSYKIHLLKEKEVRGLELGKSRADAKVKEAEEDIKKTESLLKQNVEAHKAGLIALESLKADKEAGRGNIKALSEVAEEQAAVIDKLKEQLLHEKKGKDAIAEEALSYVDEIAELKNNKYNIKTLKKSQQQTEEQPSVGKKQLREGGKILRNLFPRLNFTKDTYGEILENKWNSKLLYIMHSLSSNIKLIDGVEQEKWHEYKDAMEYKFSKEGRVIVDFSEKQKPNIKQVTFNHNHCK